MVDSTDTTSRKQWVIAIGGMVGFVGLLVFGMWVSDPNKGKPDMRELAKLEAQEVRENYKARSVDAITPKERWISKSEKELTAYQSSNRQLRQDQVTMQKKLDNLEQMIRAGNFKKSASNSSPAVGTLPPTPTNQKELPVVKPGLPSGNNSSGIKDQIAENILPPTPQGRSASGNGKNGNTGSTIQVFEFDDETASKDQGDSKNISHYMPAGSFGKIILLSGVDAPTGGEAANNPVPILMRLLDHGTLPNYFKSEIKDCHVTGAVRGDLSSERGKIRTERLSCVLVNGDVVDVKVKGWVNGEDGKEGFRGKVVEKAGALLARTFVAGIFSGIGNNTASQYQNISQNALGTVSSINPGDVGKAGVATGLSTSMENLSEYYMDRANEMYPIIEVAANRIGELVLSEGVDFKRNIIGNMGGEL